jgi:hypothetical protein
VSGKAASQPDAVVISLLRAAEVGSIIFSDFLGGQNLRAVSSHEHQISPKNSARPKKQRTPIPPMVWVTHASCEVRRAMCSVGVGHEKHAIL